MYSPRFKVGIVCVVFYLFVTLRYGVLADFSYLTSNGYLLFIIFSFTFIMVFFIFLFYFYRTSLFFRSGSKVFIIIVTFLYFITTYLITIKFFVFALKIIPQSLLVANKTLGIILLSIMVFIHIIPFLIVYCFFVMGDEQNDYVVFRWTLRSIKYNIYLFFIFFLDFFFYFISNYITIGTSVEVVKVSFNFFSRYWLNYNLLLLVISILALIVLVRFSLKLKYDESFSSKFFTLENVRNFFIKLLLFSIIFYSCLMAIMFNLVFLETYVSCKFLETYKATPRLVYNFNCFIDIGSQQSNLTILAHMVSFINLYNMFFFFLCQLWLFFFCYIGTILKENIFSDFYFDRKRIIFLTLNAIITLLLMSIIIFLIYYIFCFCGWGYFLSL